MKYAIIGLGLAALVVGCDSSGQHFAPDSVQPSTPQIELICKADGGVERLELTAVPIDNKDIPGWATKTCGPIRKATYPPLVAPLVAPAGDSCGNIGQVPCPMGPLCDNGQGGVGPCGNKTTKSGTCHFDRHGVVCN